jgi:Leucine-rich repeat (LRR) protein
VSDNEQLQNLPLLANLTELRTLKLFACQQLQEIPPLDSLCSLQELEVISCHLLKSFPPLDNLPALEKLTLDKCKKLSRDGLRLPSSQDCDINVYGLSEKKDLCNAPGEHVEGKPA